jgi:hypothetical protein
MRIREGEKGMRKEKGQKGKDKKGQKGKDNWGGSFRQRNPCNPGNPRESAIQDNQEEPD